MFRIVVEFADNRDHCGLLTLEDDIGEVLVGPFPVAGRASDEPAAMHGNDSRDPLLPYGDAPTGKYRLSQLVKGRNEREFGPAVLVLEPVSGDAALAEELVDGESLEDPVDEPARQEGGQVGAQDERERGEQGGEIGCQLIMQAAEGAFEDVAKSIEHGSCLLIGIRGGLRGGVRL